MWKLLGSDDSNISADLNETLVSSGQANSFLIFSINEWNKLDPDIRNLDSHAMFRKKLLTFIRPSEKSAYNIYHPKRSKILNRMRLGFSLLREQKFRHNFADIVNPLCSCPLEAESTDHFFLRWQNFVSFAKPLWIN